MARHYLVFDLLVLTGILSFLYDYFLLGNIRPLNTITFGCLIGVWFYLIYFLPRILEHENFIENLEHECIKIKMRALIQKWENRARGAEDSTDAVVNAVLLNHVKEVRTLMEEDPPREVKSK